MRFTPLAFYSRGSLRTLPTCRSQAGGTDTLVRLPLDTPHVVTQPAEPVIPCPRSPLTRAVSAHTAWRNRWISARLSVKWGWDEFLSDRRALPGLSRRPLRDTWLGPSSRPGLRANGSDGVSAKAADATGINAASSTTGKTILDAFDHLLEFLPMWLNNTGSCPYASTQTGELQAICPFVCDTRT